MTGQGPERGPTRRWEDVIPVWSGPDYRHLALRHPPSVDGWAAGAIISSVDTIDWPEDGATDLVVSSWDACYGGVVRLFEQTGPGRTGIPGLRAGPILDGISGQASVVREGDRFGLLTTSRLRRSLHLSVNQGSRQAPRFADPIEITLDADWLHDGEFLHRAVFADIDGDGRQELVVGTDFWGDYWPDGVEWFEKEYRPYDAEGRWRGGPLRGHLYVFRNSGGALAPALGRGTPLLSDGRTIEVYGQAAPAFGDFRGTGRTDLICGDFLDRLHFFPGRGDGTFGPKRVVRASDGGERVLDHCIHFPTAVQWSGGAGADLLVAAEDGHVWFLRNAGKEVEGSPAFDAPVRLAAADTRIHAGIVPVPAAADWTGDGIIDLVVGNSGGELLFFPGRNAADAEGRPVFGAGTPLYAAGTPISLRAGDPGSLQGPAEIKFGYTCPTAVDWDGDGLPDLLVSGVDGLHRFFRCLRLGNPPEFEAGRLLTVDGAPLRTVWRVRPAVVAWKADDEPSYVTLDADGVLASYRRHSETALGDKRPLCFADGTPVRFTEDFGGGLGRIKLCFCDWTGGGRQDLLIGTHSRASVPPGPAGMPRHTTGQSAVLLLANIGTDAAPEFAPPRPLCYRGEPIAIGMHACAPEAVRRPGRMLPDLLVGAEDGTLLWFAREDLSW